MKRALTLASLALLAVSACSKNAEPTESFEQDGTRVFEAYGQNGKVTKEVTIPPGTTILRLRMDCINTSGSITVGIGTGFGDVPCMRESAPGGSIGIGAGGGETFDSSQTITVTAPADSTWSVAVDAVDAPLRPE